MFPNGTNLFSTMSKGESIIPMFEKLNDDLKLKVQEELNALDYSIDEIKIVKIGDEKSDIRVLQINEKDVSTFLWEGLLSQGMQRTLYILVLLFYIVSQKRRHRQLLLMIFVRD